MRVLGIIVIILGLVGIVFGILFFPQANSARDEVATAIAPIPLDQLDATYDRIVMAHDAQRAQEEPNIQAGKAMPSDIYNYYSAQRGLLGLAKTNIGTATLVNYLGIISIATGVGLAITGVVITLKK